MIKIIVESTRVNHNVVLVNKDKHDFVVKSYTRPLVYDGTSNMTVEDTDQLNKAHTYAYLLYAFLARSQVHAEYGEFNE